MEEGGGAQDREKCAGVTGVGVCEFTPKSLNYCLIIVTGHPLRRTDHDAIATKLALPLAVGTQAGLFVIMKFRDLLCEMGKPST